MVVLLLQFIMDSQNDKKAMTNLNMDILCEYINEFMESNMSQMAEYYELENLWLLRADKATHLFHLFFQWSMRMKYVTYHIALKKDAHSNCST